MVDEPGATAEVHVPSLFQVLVVFAWGEAGQVRWGSKGSCSGVVVLCAGCGLIRGESTYPRPPDFGQKAVYERGGGII